MAETKNMTKTKKRIKGAPVPPAKNTSEIPPQRAVARATVFFMNLKNLLYDKIK